MWELRCSLGRGCGYSWRVGSLQEVMKPGSLAFYLVLDEETVDWGTFLSSVLTYTSLEMWFGICWFPLFEHWLYRIEITILHCESLKQKAIIVTAKSKTSAWGKILLVWAMKLLLWGRALMAVPALFCYVAQFTSSDCASILLSFFYIPINCWMKKALREGLEEYCLLPQIT